MRPPIWEPPIELSANEKQVAQRIRKAKLFLFLREIRHELFDAEFQVELAKIFKDSSVGLCPVPPAQIALAIILQAYTGVSDDEAIEAMVMDRRWQLVLDCLDSEQAPFGKGTLVRFRAALIASEGDRMLIEKTISMAQLRQGFSSRTLRAALDSSPLWGTARVEDTYNLLGHALRKALLLIARDQKQDLSTIASQAGADILAESSLKAALDLDWDDPQQKTQALTKILQTLNTIESWLQEQNKDMRHGRKSRNQRFDGYKRHVLKDVDLGMVRAVGVTRANQPEAEVTPAIETDLQHQKVQLKELRERQHTVQGRAKLRERVSVEHCLAKIGQWQGEKARYIGLRKNLFDLRRMAIVHNLHVLAQMPLTNSLGQTS